MKRKAVENSKKKEQIEDECDLFEDKKYFHIEKNDLKYNKEFLESDEAKFSPHPNNLKLSRIDQEGKSYFPFWLDTIDFYRNRKFDSISTSNSYRKKENSLQKQQIYLFGVGKNKKDDQIVSVCLKIKNFCPYFYIVLPHLNTNRFRFLEQLKIDIKSYKSGTEQKKYKEIFRVFQGERKNLEESQYAQYAVHEIKCIIKRPMIGYHSIELKQVSLLAKIYCKNESIREKLVLFLKKNFNYEITHDFVKPEIQFITEMLRTKVVSEFNQKELTSFTIQHPFSVCKWMKIYHFTALGEDEKQVHTAMQANIRMEDIQVMEKTQISEEFILAPQRKVVALDIETLSADGLRHPNPLKKNDMIGTIVCTLFHYYSSEPYATVWFCLGKTLNVGKSKFPSPTSAQTILNRYILHFPSEKDLLIIFQKWWIKVDPDIYNTFNGDRYDFPYILERLKVYNLPRVFGRFPNIEIESNWKLMQQKGFWSKKQNNKESLLLFDQENNPNHKKQKLNESQQQQQQQLQDIRFQGRVSLDGLPWVLKEKREDYSLKGVIKKDLKNNNNNKIDEKEEKEEKVEEPDTEGWIYNSLLNPSHFGKIDLPYEKISPYAIFSPLHRYALAYYCYMDTVYSWKIMRETNKIEMISQRRASTGVDSYTCQNAGQQILVYSKLIRTIDAGQFYFNINDWSGIRPAKYEGGICIPTISGQTFGTIILDFSALYPTAICVGHFSYETLIFTEEMKKTVQSLNLQTFSTVCKISNTTYEWVQLPKTIMNTHLEDLSDSRQFHKKQVTEVNDEKLKIYHQAAELDDKLNSNSTYGVVGVPTIENSPDFARTRTKRKTTKPALTEGKKQCNKKQKTISSSSLSNKNYKEKEEDEEENNSNFKKLDCDFSTLFINEENEKNEKKKIKNLQEQQMVNKNNKNNKKNKKNKNTYIGKHSAYFPIAGFHAIATATTYLGRMCIEFIRDEFLHTGICRIIQGDTDSIFIEYFGAFLGFYVNQFGFKKEWLIVYKEEKNIEKMKMLDLQVLTKIYDKTETIKNEILSKKEINFHPDQKMKFNAEIERICWTLHTLLIKKQYLCYTFVKEENKAMITLSNGKQVYSFIEKLKIKGCQTERRDCNPFLKEVIGHIIKYLVVPTDEDRKFGFTGFVLFPEHEYLIQRKKRIIETISEYMHDKSCELASGKIPLEQLAKTKKLKESYTRLPEHALVAKKLNDEGEQIEVNTKIKIIKVNIKRSKKIEEWDELSQIQTRNLPVDYMYYVKELYEAVSRILIIHDTFTPPPTLHNRLFMKEDIDFIFADSYQLATQTMNESAMPITHYFKKVLK